MKNLEKIITKELLGSVLPKETENLSEDFSFYTDEDNIVFSDDGEMQFEYCIYKFAFKCKEWAIKQSNKENRITYTEITQLHTTFYKNNKVCCCIQFFYEDNKSGASKEFIADTEVEAIIKACEWVLNEINK